MGVIGRRARRGGRASPDHRPHEIVVEVDRLVIDGIESLDRDVLGSALEAELATRLASMGNAEWGAGGVDVDRLRATVDIGPVGPGRSRSIGSVTAASVHGAVVSAVRSGGPARPDSNP